MDTKKLVVGQIVPLRSGPFGHEGKVVKVTPKGGIEVEATAVQTPTAGRTLLLRFGELDDGNNEGPWETGLPWKIDWDGMEQALLWDRRRLYAQSLVVGQKVPMHRDTHTCRGIVVSITPRGIEVVIEEGPNVAKGQPLRFNSGGSPYDEGMHKWNDFNPWELDVQAER